MPELDPSPADYLGDPLSDVARRERRNLVVGSAIAALIAHTGLLPTEIQALGIKLEPPAQSTFLTFLALMVAYFLVAFSVYGISDFLLWRDKYQEHLKRVERFSQDLDYGQYQMEEELYRSLPSINWLYAISPGAAYVRIFFEFVLPILIGGYAIVVLLLKATNG